MIILIAPSITGRDTIPYPEGLGFRNNKKYKGHDR
jgi:hypothetical protein